GSTTTRRPSPWKCWKATASRGWAARAWRGSGLVPSARRSNRFPATTMTPGPAQASIVLASSVTADTEPGQTSRRRSRSLTTRTRAPTGMSRESRSEAPTTTSVGPCGGLETRPAEGLDTLWQRVKAITRLRRDVGFPPQLLHRARVRGSGGVDGCPDARDGEPPPPYPSPAAEIRQL